MIYVIIPFEQGKGFLSKLETLDISVCDVEAPAAYFVSFNGTTRKLSEAIGYGNDEDVGSGVVIPVSNYFGYASAELWEWLEIHRNRPGSYMASIRFKSRSTGSKNESKGKSMDLKQDYGASNASSGYAKAF